MKDERFNGVYVPFGSVSPEILEIVSLVADKEYCKALSMVDEYISKNENNRRKNIAAMMSLQILALAGYKEIASILLEALLDKFDTHSKERDLCQRTISKI